jgi:NAD(P)-dependent dehydrogenase (short-subunit alcohol dehydrogenase family)
MARFQGKSVVVTGAGSGIGRATALLFAQEGAQVLAVDLSDGVEETAALASGGGSIAPRRGDCGSEADVEAFMDEAAARHGGIDIVFANAGIGDGLAGLFDQDAQGFADVLRVNLIGPFLAVKYAVPHLIRRGGGAIVCTASVAGLRAGAGGIAYSASKAGVINLVETAAQQLTRTNIRINAVCPGLIETGMTRFVYDRARETGKTSQIGQFTPLRRGGEPHEIATAVAFLASDDASYVTGHALVVDGGLSSSHPFGRPRETGSTHF